MPRHVIRSGTVLCFTAGLALSGGPATAAADAPYWANRIDTFTDAAGATNGCVLRLGLRTDDGPAASEPGVLELQNRYRLDCPASAGVLRRGTNNSLDILHGDGTVETVDPFDARLSIGTSGSPQVGGFWSFEATACQGSTRGTHTYRARVVMKVWRTADASDEPFVARAQQVRTLTCEP